MAASIASLRSYLPRLATTSKSSGSLRLLSSSPRVTASVTPPSLSEVLNSNGLASTSSSQETPAQRARKANLSPQDLAREVELTRERKLKEYEDRIRIKAMEQGLSIEELRAQALERAAAQARVKAAAAEAKATEAAANRSSEQEALEERDARVAREIRVRAEAEAKRKLASGDYGSGPGGKGSVKPLSQIIDLTKLESADAGKIGELWTGYHTLKGKLSAVIPAHLYASMLERGRAFPQFVLPLPKKIVDESGESKQGYEMHLCEWALLPPPPPLPFEAARESNKTPPRPSTVLFTPLAEYKLRQEFAQPMLVLTHYTDLAVSKGIVLLRGEITAAEAAAAAPTGFAAAAAAAQRGASKEEQEKLLLPLQSEGRMSQNDAQLLAMSLQRYYMPTVDGSDAEGSSERLALLESFHRNPAQFSVEKLTKATFVLS